MVVLFASRAISAVAELLVFKANKDGYTRSVIALHYFAGSNHQSASVC